MKKKHFNAVFLFCTLTISLFIAGCGGGASPARPTAVVQAERPAVQTKQEDKDFDAVFGVAKYFSTKEYEGDKRLYNSNDLVIPEVLKEPLEYLAVSNISYAGLLMNEIKARHYATFENKLYQRIFNFTSWYDQKLAKKGGYRESQLNDVERENLKWLDVEEKVLEEKQTETKIAMERSKQARLETEKPPYKAYCDADNVNVRDLNWTFKDWDVPVYKTTSYTNYKVLGQLMRGNLVEIVEVKGEWARVKKEGLNGWTARIYLSPAIKDLIASAIVITNIGTYRKGVYPDVDKSLESYKKNEGNNKYKGYGKNNITIGADKEVKILNTKNEEIIYKIKPDDMIKMMKNSSNEFNSSAFERFYSYALSNKEENYQNGFFISKTGDYVEITMGDPFFTADVTGDKVLHGIYYKGKLMYTFIDRNYMNSCNYYLINDKIPSEYVLITSKGLIFKDGKIVKDLKPVLKGFSPAYVSIPEENRVVFYSDGNLVCTDWDGRVVWNKKVGVYDPSTQNEPFSWIRFSKDEVYDCIINFKNGYSFAFPSSTIPADGWSANLVKIDDRSVIVQKINMGKILNQALILMNEDNALLLKLSTNDFNLR